MIPTMDAVEGIKFDFNDGLRVLFPKQNKKIYRCIFKDLDSDVILFSSDTKPGCVVTSVKKFFIRFKLEIFEKDKFDKPVFEHIFDLKDKEVFVQIPKGALGDSIAWFSYVQRFQIKNQCKVTVMMSNIMIELFKDQYPQINFIQFENAGNIQPYATYRLGLFFKGNVDNQPYDFRQVGLHKTAGYILGLTTQEQLADLPPRVNLSAERTIKEKYIVIASHSSSQCKMWNHPSGWREIVKYLKEKRIQSALYRQTN